MLLGGRGVLTLLQMEMHSQGQRARSGGGSEDTRQPPPAPSLRPFLPLPPSLPLPCSPLGSRVTLRSFVALCGRGRLVGAGAVGAGKGRGVAAFFWCPLFTPPSPPCPFSAPGSAFPFVKGRCVFEVCIYIWHLTSVKRYRCKPGVLLNSRKVIRLWNLHS